MGGKIEPLQEAHIPALSEFIRASFCPPGAYCVFAEPEVFRWKYFAERGRWSLPRSYIVSEEEHILAHAGVFTTAFGTPAEPSVPAVHIIDWLTSEAAASFGALLMMRAFSLAPVTYALGCTPAASRVLLRAGFEIVGEVPLFHRVVRRMKPGVWRELHGTQTLARAAALLALDFAQSFRPGGCAASLKLRPVSFFGDEVWNVLKNSSYNVTCTSRSPEILNHYLQFPLNNFRGFLLEDTRVRGFALLTLVNKPHVQVGRIVECFLDTPDARLWNEAIALLEAEAVRQGAEVISCYGSTPWMSAALRNNGFFRRGRTPFYLRDPKRLVPRSAPFHLTHLEADLSFI